VGAGNAIQFVCLGVPGIVVVAMVWEIEANSVGNGRLQGRLFPAGEGFVDNPRDGPDRHTDDRSTDPNRPSVSVQVIPQLRGLAFK